MEGTSIVIETTVVGEDTSGEGGGRGPICTESLGSRWREVCRWSSDRHHQWSLGWTESDLGTKEEGGEHRRGRRKRQRRNQGPGSNCEWTRSWNLSRVEGRKRRVGRGHRK